MLTDEAVTTVELRAGHRILYDIRNIRDIRIFFVYTKYTIYDRAAVVYIVYQSRGEQPSQCLSVSRAGAVAHNGMASLTQIADISPFLGTKSLGVDQTSLSSLRRV